MNDAEDEALAERLERVEALVQKIEEVRDETARERARDVVAAVLDLHAAAFSRVLAGCARQGDAGRRLLDELAADSVVSSVLVLHELHPRDLEARVHAALEGMRTGLVLGVVHVRCTPNMGE